MNNKLKALCKFRNATVIQKRQTDAGNGNRVRRLIRYGVEKNKDIMQILALYRESIALTDKAGLLAYSSGYRPSHGKCHSGHMG